MMIQNQKEAFSLLSSQQCQWVEMFNDEMEQLGCDCGPGFTGGFCWGVFMLSYSRTGLKSKKVMARIYVREQELILRLYLSKLDAHRAYLEQLPENIRQVFTGPFGQCSHCHNQKEGNCRFRKVYTLEGRLIEKCNGYTFQFFSPEQEDMRQYLGLIREFYPVKKGK